MPDIVIRHAQTARPLYTGRHRSIRAGLEAAVAQGLDLSGADLRHANLTQAELDGAKLKGARLDHANLAGANLSEGAFDGTVFAHAGLQNACLCFSTLAHCDFTNASFGATDIAGARLDKARFSTLSAFTLNFRDAETLADCLWFNEDGLPCPFSRPPITVNGLLQPVIMLDRHIQVGQVTIPAKDWAMQPPTPSTARHLRRNRPCGPQSFINTIRPPLTALVQGHALDAL